MCRWTKFAGSSTDYYPSSLYERPGSIDNRIPLPAACESLWTRHKGAATGQVQPFGNLTPVLWSGRSRGRFTTACAPLGRSHGLRGRREITLQNRLKKRVVISAGSNSVQARTVREKPRTPGPPVRHDRDVDIECRELRTEHPAALAHVRLELLPEPLAISISRSPQTLRIRAHPALGIVSVRKGGVDVCRDPDEPPQERGPPWRTGVGRESGLWVTLGEQQRECRTLGHERAVGQVHRRDLSEGVDAQQPVAGRAWLIKAGNILDAHRCGTQGQHRLSECRAPPRNRKHCIRARLFHRVTVAANRGGSPIVSCATRGRIPTKLQAQRRAAGYLGNDL